MIDDVIVGTSTIGVQLGLLRCRGGRTRCLILIIILINIVTFYSDPYHQHQKCFAYYVCWTVESRTVKSRHCLRDYKLTNHSGFVCLIEYSVVFCICSSPCVVWSLIYSLLAPIYDLFDLCYTNLSSQLPTTINAIYSF